MKRILVTGAGGQIGTELTRMLREEFGADNVVASDAKDLTGILEGPRELLDVLNREKLWEIVERHKVDTIFHLAAILSATGERNPQLCHRVNTEGFFNVLELAREKKLDRVICPSSIAAFSPETGDNPGEVAVLRPKTMYGITKVWGELMGEYYWEKFRVDVRGMRYPGIISWQTEPGGGTTDYAVAAYYEALRQGSYECFVSEDTVLPMMYMPDALKALVDLARAERSSLRYCNYNVASLSFSAGEMAQAIRKIIPGFTCSYVPDERQKIADTWPQRLNDAAAREDWSWSPQWDLDAMSRDMIDNLRKKLGISE
jgi:nucleoside-diphosphate-sugar epimerase